MTYEVDVSGNVIVIQIPPKQLQQNWEDFEIQKRVTCNTTKPYEEEGYWIHLKNRTPWYNDVVAKLYVLSQYFKGELKGKGEDGEPYTITLPIAKESIIEASERNVWKPSFCIYQIAYGDKDRFYSELKKINFENLYPEWLAQIPKTWREY
jgi:hypothetical protein